MPLTSRRRSTARPATARPSASSGRPALVVSVITKPRPSPRSVSTARSIRCAAAGSSQAPKASTRSGTAPDTTIPESPKISGWSLPAAQATSTCGCDSSSVLSRSMSARSTMLSSCAAPASVAAVRRVRSRTTTASIAKKSSPRVKVSSPSCSRVTAKPSAKPGAPKPVSRARCKALQKSKRRGIHPAADENAASRSPSGLSPALRPAPGMRAASAAPRANRRTLLPWGVGPKESRS